MSIVRLSGQPLQRLRSWLHVKTLQFAFGEAIQTYVVGLTLLLLIAFHFFDKPLAGDEVDLNNFLFWYRLDERLF